MDEYRPDFGSETLQSLLKALQASSGADVALLGEICLRPRPRVQILAIRGTEEHTAGFSYLLDTHPCSSLRNSSSTLFVDSVTNGYPEAYLLQDFGMSAYAGRWVPGADDSAGFVIVALARQAWGDRGAVDSALTELAAHFADSHPTPLDQSIECARRERRLFIREESFREYVFDNPTGYAFTEVMPPLPLHLPREQTLQRLMYTAIVTECNPAMARMYGMASTEAFIGRHTVDAYGPERARRNIEYWLNQDYDIRNVESQTVDADGNVAWVSGSVFGTIVDGHLLHFWTKRRDLTEQKRYETAILHKADHDALTGLPNRHWFQERIAALTADHLARDKRLCIGLLDLNGFKEINDTLGHSVGDQILKAVGIRLLKGLKTHGAEIARLGGDEFAIILPEILDPRLAEDMADNLEQLLAQPFVIEEMPLMVNGSLGLVMFPDWQGGGEDLLRLADVAMYAAKNEGRAFRWYQKEIDKHSRRRLSLLTMLPRALEEQQLFLVYQPKIDLPSRKPTGVEALIRWQHPEHGLIPPNDFIPFAEANEVIRPLTHWVLQEAIRQGSLWLQRGLRLHIAVNVSVRNLLDEKLERVICECLSEHTFPADLLELEVTESALMTHPAQAMSLLHSLRALGVSIAIDDFGTGYSSLAYLARLPVTTLKVDQSFVKDMVHAKSEAQIVRSIIGLAHQCELSVVAEGVEDEATLQALAEMGSNHAQGYFIARPMPADQLGDWVRAYPS